MKRSVKTASTWRGLGDWIVRLGLQYPRQVDVVSKPVYLCGRAAPLDDLGETSDDDTPELAPPRQRWLGPGVDNYS